MLFKKKRLKVKLINYPDCNAELVIRYNKLTNWWTKKLYFEKKKVDILVEEINSMKSLNEFQMIFDDEASHIEEVVKIIDYPYQEKLLMLCDREGNKVCEINFYSGFFTDRKIESIYTKKQLRKLKGANK